MLQNALAARLGPGLGFSAPPDLLAGFGEGNRQRERAREGKGTEGQGKKGEGSWEREKGRENGN